MFAEKKPVKGETTGMSNRILADTSIKGEVSSESDFRIDGKFEGTVKTSGKLVIGRSGSINGKAYCSNADIEGTFTGTLVVSGLLSLKGTAAVDGEVKTGKLSVQEGASFNATCDMNTKHIDSASKDYAKKSAS